MYHTIYIYICIYIIYLQTCDRKGMSYLVAGTRGRGRGWETQKVHCEPEIRGAGPFLTIYPLVICFTDRWPI